MNNNDIRDRNSSGGLFVLNGEDNANATNIGNNNQLNNNNQLDISIAQGGDPILFGSGI
jgi:hypothetical protein